MVLGAAQPSLRGVRRRMGSVAAAIPPPAPPPASAEQAAFVREPLWLSSQPPTGHDSDME